MELRALPTALMEGGVSSCRAGELEVNPSGYNMLVHTF